MATDNTNASESTTASDQGNALKVNDVLSGIPLDPSDTTGAYLTFQTIGDTTVISIGAGLGPEAPVAVVTLANVTGKTLQDLLNDIPMNV
jgi:hypothetical protein